MCRFKIVVPILIDIISVRRINIEPWIMLEFIAIRIEFVHWVKTSCMVKYHIKNHCYTTFVALINKNLELLRSTIRFVKREIVIRRITPVEVAVKLLNRHKLNSVDTHILVIIHTVGHTFDSTLNGMIVDPCLVYNKVVLIWALEVERCF